MVFLWNFLKEVFGGVAHYETFEYEVVEQHDDWEVRKYPSAVAAVTKLSRAQRERGEDRSFMKLAKYIGVFSKPENRGSSKNTESSAGDPDDGGQKTDGEAVAMTTPVVMTSEEPIAMTTPVVMTSEEPIAMTTPVVMTSEEPIAMTTPVVVSAENESQSSTQDEFQLMKFVLPAKYQKVEDAPAPTNPDVFLELVPGKLVAACSFSGKADHEQMEKEYEALLEKSRAAGYEQTGKWEGMFFNPPYTLPWLRRNDICIPIRKK